jgi:hypothetical protein
VRVRTLALALALGLTTLAREASAVEGGATDRRTTHAVALAQGSPSKASVVCSATLVSANVVLTVRHCVAPVVQGVRPCDTSLGDVAPDVVPTFWVNASAYAEAGSPSWRRASAIRVPEHTSICGDDIALVSFDDPFDARDAVPARPVVDEATFLRLVREQNVALSAFGATAPDANDIGDRRSRFDIPVGCVPGEAAFRCGNELDFIDFAREFTTGRGPCRGDSGGGAMPASDPALVLGVLSRGDRGSDGASCSLGVFERTDRWAYLIARTVLEHATAAAPAPDWATALFPVSPKLGEHCTGAGTCGEGAECVTLDDRRSWQCAELCASPTSCGAGRACTNGFCVRADPAPPAAATSTCGHTFRSEADASWIAFGVLALLGLRRRSVRVRIGTVEAARSPRTGVDRS